MEYKESSYEKFINQLFAQDSFIKERMILRYENLQAGRVSHGRFIAQKRE